MQADNINCNTCDYNILDSQRSVTCTACHNHYHLKKSCLRLDNLDLKTFNNVNNFKCYQCLEFDLPFNSLSEEDFQINSTNVNEINRNLNELNRLTDLIFNPFQTQEEDSKNNDVDRLINPELNCQDINVNSITNYYSTLEFNDKLNANNITNTDLSLLHLNVRSMRNKFDSILNYLNSLAHDFSVIALTETWLNDNDDETFQLPGYNLTQLNRNNKNGGGICVFTKENLKIKPRTDLTIENDSKNIESLFIEIINENYKNVIIGTIYRPPNNKFRDFECDLKDILSKLDKKNKPCYIMGDFNIDLLKYNKCNFSNQFFNQFSSSGYRPLITRPTRITSSSATLIDNIFTNNLLGIENLNGVLINDISDHLPIFSITKYNALDKSKTPASSKFISRLITQSSLDSFTDKLKKIDWITTIQENDPTKSLQAFLKILCELYDKYFPVKISKRSNIKRLNNSWISKGLKKSSKTKERLYKKFLKCPTKSNEEKYKTYRNKLNHLVRIAKKKYYNNKFFEAKNDIKSTWQTINELIGKKRSNKTLPTSFINENDTIDNPKIIAQKFNEFFVNVGPNLAAKFNNSNKFEIFLKGDYMNSIFLHNTSYNEIIKVINK